MNNYVLSIYDNKKNDAGPKAKQDIDKFLTEENFEIIKLKLSLTTSLAGRLTKIKYSLFDIPNIFRRRKINTLVLQYPFYSLFLMKKLINNAKKHSDTNLVFIIHDVESLRLFKNDPAYVASEIKLLNAADGLVVHNQKMLSWLKQNGVTTQMVPLEVFDYDNPQNFQTSSDYERSVCFAGNLKKSEFLEKMHSLNEIDIYGPNPAKSYPDGLNYKGSYSPEELPKYLTQNFGLVWDGTELSQCNSVFGEYMKFNNPHKVSLYLSSGIPVIIWDKAALADFIVSNGVGIAISNLNDLDDILKNVSPDEYKKMRQKTISIGKKMRNGHYIKKAISAFD